MRYQYRPFATWGDDYIVAMVDHRHGMKPDDANSLWEEMDYRTDHAKQAATAIIDRAANECLQSAQGIGSVYIDAADMLMSVCRYLIHPSYHRSMDGVATNRVYMHIVNTRNTSFCDMLANQSN